MEIRVLKPKSLFFATDFNITVNGTKYVVNKDLTIEVPESKSVFFISMFYLKTKEYRLENGDSFTIEVDRILNRSKLLMLCAVTAIIFLLHYFFENESIENVLRIYLYLLFGFFILINTIFYRYYFTVKIKKG